MGGRARSYTGELPDERIFQVTWWPTFDIHIPVLLTDTTVDLGTYMALLTNGCLAAVLPGLCHSCPQLLPHIGSYDLCRWSSQSGQAP